MLQIHTQRRKSVPSQIFQGHTTYVSLMSVCILKCLHLMFYINRYILYMYTWKQLNSTEPNKWRQLKTLMGY